MMTKVLDRFGICVSGICVVHCILTPFVIILFPALNTSHFFHEWFHLIFGTVVITSVLIAVYPHCNRHGHKDIVAFALLGSISILFALFFGHDISEYVEHGFTILGSILLITAHIKNMKVRHGKCSSAASECSSSN
jgi:hypothetical protein